MLLPTAGLRRSHSPNPQHERHPTTSPRDPAKWPKSRLMHEDGAERSTAELRDAVAGQFGISEAERQEMIPSGRARLLDNRIGWALTHLSQAGALVNIEAQLPLLSTVLGHVHPADTFWYFEGAPELLALACERLEQTWQQASTDQPTNAQARMPLSWERSRRRRPRQMHRGKGQR